MLRSYYIAAVRNILRHKSDSLINLLGLTIGLSMMAFILVSVIYVYHREDFHADHDRIMRIVQIKTMNDGSQEHFAYSPAKLPAAIKEISPEVLSFTRISGPRQRVVHFGNEYTIEKPVLNVDPEFLKIFSFRLIQGDLQTCLTDTSTLVLTETTARKYFGDINPVGKTLELDKEASMRITGVVEDPPSTSHLQFSMLESFATLEASMEWQSIKTWHTSVIAYLLLDDPGSRSKVESELLNAYYKSMPREDLPELYLQPIDRIYLYSNHISFDYLDEKSSINQLYLLISLGLIVLMLACANYVNLATARSMLRMREVGLRKIVGATRSQLMLQYLGESIFTSLLALPLALLLVELFMPWLNEITGLDIPARVLYQGWTIIYLLIITILVGFLAGIYPAFVLSNLKPFNMAKGKMITPHGKLLMRKSLVIGQFSISLTLIITLFLIHSQMKFLMDHPLGYDYENRLVIPFNEKCDPNLIPAMLNELRNDPNILNATRVMVVPGGELAFNHIYPEGYTGEDPLIVNMNLVDPDFLRTMNIDLISGRNFYRDSKADYGSIIINQAALRLFGWDNIDGKHIGEKEDRNLPVVGLVKDYHDAPLHGRIKPKILINYPIDQGMFVVQIKPEKAQSAIAGLEKIWNSYNPQTPLDYTYQEELIHKWYISEKRIENLVSVFTFLSTFIACLGLVGLTMFVTQRRTREIGIRKVLGADISVIIRLLIGEFTLLVCLSCLISWPLAYIIGTRWLENFAFTIDINPITFILAGILTITGAMILVGTLAFKASSANPVEALRYE